MTGEKRYVELGAVIALIEKVADGYLYVETPKDNLIADVNGIPSADVVERPQWISVKERLPEPRFAREWYLVALESGCVKTLAYEKPMVKGALFHKGWHETASPVTHWMPLPEPPKKRGCDV